MTDVATTCDGCTVVIEYGQTCYAVPDSTTHDGLPVVRILCQQCQDLAPTGPR